MMGGRRYYSRRHYDRITNGGPDTPESIQERQIHRQAVAAAVADREEHFPDMTADPLGALRYQDERIAHHRARLLGGAL